MRTLYLCGGGNPEGVRLALRVNEVEKRWDRIVLLDDDPAKHGREFMGVPCIGGFGVLAEADPKRSWVANLVARTTVRRWRARNKIASYGLPFARLVDPEVDTSGAELATDVIVYRYATIGPEARIADGCCVFMGAVVGHEAILERGCVVAPNAAINARVHLGEGVYVGSCAAILPEVEIGAWATVGACSMVVQRIEAGETVMGVPGRALKLRAKVPPDLGTPQPEPAGRGESQER
ncbi:MAG: hypothetical protein D6718_09760 [Acidobacteria bacterium]|nr:MAG: hypothetical protein D6718_09760 [Acidobacteriota bacterium]